MRVSEALVRAKGLISNEMYWVKGTVLDERTGQMCAVGAIQMAVAGDVRPKRAQMGDEKFKLYTITCMTLMQGIHLVQRSTEIPAGSIPGFNDAARTTHKDVMAAFDAAIELQRMTEEPAPVEAPEEELVLA